VVTKSRQELEDLQSQLAQIELHLQNLNSWES
jgi:hypothetical protein